MTTQFMMKELCAQISELADATATENAELVATKEELEIELQQLKRATTAGYGTQRAVANVNGALNGPPLALCVIDGWRASFAMRFVKQGEAGGRMAGQHLLRELYTELGVTTGPDNAHPPIWTSVFLSVRALTAGLVKQGTSTADEVEGFIKGLSQAHQALVLVDVASKRDVDEKIRAYMATFSRLPQVTRVFFAGGFASPFASIARDVAQNKLVFLRNRTSAAPPAMDPDVPVLLFEDMFVDMSLYDTSISVPFSPSLTTVSVSAPSPTPPLFSPRLRTCTTSAARSFGERDGMLRSPMSQSSDEEKPIPTINPDLPLNKQIPPPCYLHYLLGKCAHGGICTYEHRYELSDVQLGQLRKLAKGQPCAFAAKGQACLFDDGCVYGHSCPYGMARCRYLVEDKCRFSREMHN